MKTVNKRVITKLEIKKSLFIGVLDQVHSKDDIKKVIEEVKEEYPKATHYCYAYILDNIKFCSDDKEPSKTAGIPILNVLEHNDVNHIICIVIRYYGGIKLGTGGLVRAYSSSVKETLKNTSLKEYKEGLLINIETTYDGQKQLDFLLGDSAIVKKDYQENVTYEVMISKETELLLQKNKILYTIIKSCYF